jgi:hypothetical protein
MVVVARTPKAGVAIQAIAHFFVEFFHIFLDDFNFISWIASLALATTN